VRGETGNLYAQQYQEKSLLLQVLKRQQLQVVQAVMH